MEFFVACYKFDDRESRKLNREIVQDNRALDDDPDLKLKFFA
jgi:hypothetical protein